MDSPHVFQPEPAVQNPDHKRDSIVTRNVIWYSELGMNDVEIVGGKNASLGEMIANLAQSGVRVPNGFATTADAYRQFLTYEGLAERINSMLAKPDNRSEDRRGGEECVSTGRLRGWRENTKKK